MEQKWQIWDKLIFSPGMRNIGTHVHNFREVNSCCDFLVQSRRVLKPNRGKWIGGHPTTLLRTGWPKDRVQKMSPFQVEGQRQSFPYVQKKFKFYLFKWKEATTGSFCIVSCFVLSWWELHLLHLGSISCMYDVQTFQNSRIPRHNRMVTHLILDMEPRCSAWVNLFRQKSKEIVEPSAIAGRSREMSQKGSIVVDTPLHTCEKVYKMIHTGMFSFCTPVKRFTICCIQECFFLLQTWHTTSDWSFPVNIVSTMQEQEEGTMPAVTWLKIFNFNLFYKLLNSLTIQTCLINEMPVQEVKGSNEELMSILKHTSCPKCW